MEREFRLPELGENIDSATVVELLVAAGDSVEADQAVMSLETDKAEFELPCPISGTIGEVLVREGDEVRVGQVVLRILVEGEEAADAVEAVEDSAAVGRPAAENAGAHTPAQPARERPSPPATARAAGSPMPVAPAADGEVVAAPSVRKLARELGISLDEVAADCGRARLTGDDVRAFAERRGVAPAALSLPAGSPLASLLEAPVLPDFSAWGDIEIEPMSKIRRKTAENMGRAWVEIPQVTQYDEADITDLEAARKAFVSSAGAGGVHLTWTAILLEVVAQALVRFPGFNASVDMAGARIVYKKYVHVGVAVDTERGLLVPVVRDADRKTVLELATELRDLSERARSRNIQPDRMQGATFTITNLGGIGGIAFSPIVNPPQVAILGVSRSRLEPRWLERAWQPRLVLPLSLSYDHRVIDGADAARFLRWVCETLGKGELEGLETS